MRCAPQALSGPRAPAVVVYEVVVALQSLVARVPHELHEPAAHVLLQTVRRLLHHDSTHTATYRHTPKFNNITVRTL